MSSYFILELKTLPPKLDLSNVPSNLVIGEEVNFKIVASEELNYDLVLVYVVDSLNNTHYLPFTVNGNVITVFTRVPAMAPGHGAIFVTASDELGNSSTVSVGVNIYESTVVKPVEGRISRILAKLCDMLPHWFKMRRDPSSVGAQFLNVFGLTLDEVEDLLNYATSSFFIGLADTNMVDIVYKTNIPTSITEDMKVKVYGDVYVLEQTDNMRHFLTSLPTDPLHIPELYHENPFYIDYKRHILYVRKPYDKELYPPYGRITLEVYDKYNRVLLKDDFDLKLHHVWNFFDEFGLLLGIPRLFGESNAEYKERILDVFRLPANSTYAGLIKGIARDLDLINKEIWPDGGADYTINADVVQTDSIEVDGELWPADKIKRDSSGRIVLKGDPTYKGKARKIRYIAGIELHELWNVKNDRELYMELYNYDGSAKPKLFQLVREISTRIPVMWGQFRWNEGLWDIADSSYSGYGSIPSIMDAKTEGFHRG